ncbi:MAG: alpha,alpha-trehalose-phosphate synthase (UDP-forming) [Alphaproteobacteria bacterium]
MSRLIVVSNRVAPVDEGKATAGGLAVAVMAALKKSGGIWFGWSGEVSTTPPSKPRIFDVGKLTYATVDLSFQDHEEYYNGFANRTLWPLFHYRLDLTSFTRRDYAGYLRVNSLFAGKLFPLLDNGDRVWVHDYHLIPLGEALRRAGSTGPLGFFLHTPFPACEILLALPSHADLIRSLCAYDVVGFQTNRDLHCFREYITQEAGGEITDDGIVRAFGRTLKAAAFPIGVDAENVTQMAEAAQRGQQTVRMRKSLAERQLIIGVDRLDYSKGLVQRFLAFERLLESYPANRNRATLMQLAPPTRTEVPEYAEIRRELEEAAGRVNGRFADIDWVPIRYLNKSVNRRTLSGFYRVAAIGLVTPLRDGMNLVAKEYVAAQSPDDPGVLILSRFAGAAEELEQAILVNPYDIDEMAEAMQRALEMPLEERQDRWRRMNDTVLTHDVAHWRENFFAALDGAPYS